MAKEPQDGLPAFGLNGVDPLSSAVFQAFMRSLHLHRQLMLKALAEEGSHPGQAWCLRVLAAHDGISQRDLAEMLHISPPTVTTMLQRMERTGSIERRPDADDQRVTRVFLTDRGRTLEHKLRSILVGHAGRLLEGMSADDRSQFARLLGIMADNTARALGGQPAWPTPAWLTRHDRR